MPIDLKTFRKDMKKYIDYEESSRGDAELMVEIWKPRLDIAEVLGWENMDNCMITNCAGETGKIKSLKEIAETYGFRNIKHIQDTLKIMNHTITHSKMKERFLRYAHNLDIGKCEKYHKKISEFDLGDMDEIGDASQNGECVKVSIHTDGEESKSYTAEEAYRQLCNESQRAHKYRASLIEIIGLHHSQ